MGKIVELNGELSNGYNTLAIFVDENYSNEDKNNFKITDKQLEKLYVPDKINTYEEYSKWEKSKHNYTNQPYKYRLYLKVVKKELNIDHSNNILTFILFNPSTANQFDLDPTLQNCLKLLKKNINKSNKEYDGIEIFNLYNIRNPKIDNLKLCDDTCNKNLYDEIKNHIVGENIVLAWGCKNISPQAIEQMNKNKEILFKLFKKQNIKVYTLDKNITRHPNSQAWSRVGGQNKKGFIENAKLYELSIENINNIKILAKGRVR